MPGGAKPPLPPPFVADYKPYTGGQLRIAVHDACRENWDAYYRHNQHKGYKDRHYIMREFPELHQSVCAWDARAEAGGGKKKRERDTEETVSAAGAADEESAPSRMTEPRPVLLELGCGVGNAMLPMLAAHPSLAGIGFDISQVAVALMCARAKEEGLGGRCSAIAHDLSLGPVPASILPRPVPFATLIFVLCSIPVERHRAAVRHAVDCLTPAAPDGTGGGVLFFRDYCAGDMAMRRFDDGGRALDALDASKEHDATFVRTNGTLSHFFTEAEAVALFEEAGCRVVDSVVVERNVENRKQETVMARRWLQIRFRRVSSSHPGPAAHE